MADDDQAALSIPMEMYSNRILQIVFGIYFEMSDEGDRLPVIFKGSGAQSR